MKTNHLIAAVIAMLLAAAVTSAQQHTYQPGAGQPATGGQGPGMGYYYRRSMGGPGLGRGAQPGQGQTGKAQRATEPPAPPPMPDAPPQPPATPASDPSLRAMPQAAPAYRRHPGWAPGAAPPYSRPMPRSMQPGRQGYGYPGYRGRGAAPYPGHRQYGNPPGIPAGPKKVD